MIGHLVLIFDDGGRWERVVVRQNLFRHGSIAYTAATMIESSARSAGLIMAAAAVMMLAFCPHS